MSTEFRLKKLRGSGGYVMASVNDQQQMKGNLGGPDLFLAPVGRLDPQKITKYFCNTCEKEFEGAPKIQYENPNEEVAENLVLAEKGQYICNSCNSTLAEYRQFSKQNELAEVGVAKPISQEQASPKIPESPRFEIPVQTSQEATIPTSGGNVNSLSGMSVYDENAKKIGNAKQVGVDANQTLVLVITKNDGSEGSIPWTKIKKVGEIILLGTPEQSMSKTNQEGRCTQCGFSNKAGSKFCEECGTKL